MNFLKTICILCIFCLSSYSWSEQEAVQSENYRLDLTYALYSGALGQSFTGLSGYQVAFHIEDKESWLRLHYGLGLDVLAGETQFTGDSNTANFDFTTFKAMSGYRLYFYQTGIKQIYLGVQGHMGRAYFDVHGSDVLQGHAQKWVYGYQWLIGVDIRGMGRLGVGWAQEYGLIQSINNFKIQSFRISIGL